MFDALSKQFSVYHQALSPLPAFTKLPANPNEDAKERYHAKQVTLAINDSLLLSYSDFFHQLFLQQIYQHHSPQMPPLQRLRPKQIALIRLHPPDPATDPRPDPRIERLPSLA